MKKIVAGIILISIIGGCRKNAEIFDIKGVRSISISVLDKNFEKIVKEANITNTDSIKYIMRKLNNCNAEPVKFSPSHTLIINYDDSKVIKITCNGKGMKDDKGDTYMLDKRIEEIVGL